MFGIGKNNLRQRDDLELLSLIKREESKTALGILYERYAHLVMGSCLYYIKDDYEAQDLTSKIFEELSDKIKRFDIQHFKGWLFQLVKNECLMFLRKNKYHYISSDLIEAYDDDEHNKQEKECKLQLLEEAIQHLNQEQKKCIIQFYIEQKSYVTISQEENIDLNKVKSYIQNGKRNLKLLLEKHEIFQ